jgi:hypothetical protein
MFALHHRCDLSLAKCGNARRRCAAGHMRRASCATRGARIARDVARAALHR